MADIVWDKHPRVLQRNIEKYGERVITAVLALCTNEAARAQNDMRNTATWQDRTGNARSGLLVTVKKQGDQIVIYLIHSMEYGINLELNNGGRYAIILPTLESFSNELRRLLTELLR